MMSLRTLAPALLVCAALSCVCAATRAEDGFLEEPNDYSDVMDMAYTYPPRTTLGEWPTDHHDAQNSGRSPVYFNVSEYNGACQTKVAEPSPNSFFASCGATSSDGKLLFIGDSSNSLYAIDLSAKTIDLFLLLPEANGGGIVSAPAVTSRSLHSDWVFVGSTNGILYALDSANCIAGNGNCVIWNATMNNSIYASPRFTNSGVINTTYPDGILLVTSTANASDTGGTLQALNVITGEVIWSLLALDAVSGNWYGLRFVPAIDPVRPTVGYIAYGPLVVCFVLETGVVAGEYRQSVLSDPFSSSPTLPVGGTGLLLQSASTTLWRIHIAPGVGQNITLQPAWKCFYPSSNATAAQCQQWNVSSESFYSVVFLPGHTLPVPAPYLDWEEHQSAAQSRRLQQDDTTLPFSTPAISPDEQLAIYAAGTTGALIAADLLIGSLRYFFNGTEGVQFGTSRSSGAVDRIGMVFISSLAPDGETSHPVIWALDMASEQPHWLFDLGQDGDALGPASPIVTQTNLGAPLVAAVSEFNLWIFSEGLSCPSTNWQAPCSGHGSCDCNSGICTCSNCWTGPDCSIPVCSHNNSVDCNPTTGECICDPCFTGPTCNTPVCGPNSVGCNNGTCICSPCYTGPTCEIEVSCPYNSWGCFNGTCDCMPCFTGPNCTEPVNCGTNAQCNSQSGECVCNNCYTGASCNVLNTCNGEGTCNTTTGFCDCDPCWSGASCNVAQNCNQGTCNPASGTCDCLPYFTGPQCNQCYQCNSGANCQTVCNNIGVCAMNGCDCPDGWGGDTCELQCAPCMDGDQCQIFNHCSGHGTCYSNTGCACQDGWYGWTCSNQGSFSPTSSPPPHSNNNTPTNGGAIAGGVIGALFAVGIAAFCIVKRELVKMWWSSSSSSGGFTRLNGPSAAPLSTSSALGSSYTSSAPGAFTSGSTGLVSPSKGGYGTL